MNEQLSLAIKENNFTALMVLTTKFLATIEKNTKSTPLHYAVQLGKTCSALYLLKHFPCLAKLQDHEHNLPLHIAILRNRQDLILPLYCSAPHVHDVLGINRQTPIDMAKLKKQELLVNLLQEGWLSYVEQAIVQEQQTELRRILNFVTANNRDQVYVNMVRKKVICFLQDEKISLPTKQILIEINETIFGSLFTRCRFFISNHLKELDLNRLPDELKLLFSPTSLTLA